ncbi:flavodoxin domain-containing protein [Streptomyces sp. NPDC057717]|uniref:flavodoxin domain-containing protein n=1 Tax=Streptomyces sp. NPDC057717 TaxID=3346224 RepID=UPI003697E5E9
MRRTGSASGRDCVPLDARSWDEPPVPQKSVLVACGTKNGPTAQIAESIAEVLRKNGMRADAVSARSMTRVEPYDAVVVGGGLYAGRRHKDARPVPSPAVICRHLARRAHVMSDGRGWCASRNAAPV